MNVSYIMRDSVRDLPMVQSHSSNDEITEYFLDS